MKNSEHNTTPFILASTSLARKKLLEDNGIDFVVIPSEYEEDMTLPLSPIELVKHLALGKADNVAHRHPDSLVLGADTIVVFEDKVYGKPKTNAEAFEVLSMLSGTTHSIITGFALIHKNKNIHINDTDEARIIFKMLSPEAISAYIETGEPFLHAGGYAAQKGGRHFIEKYEGDMDNIIGLPIKKIQGHLGNMQNRENV